MAPPAKAMAAVRSTISRSGGPPARSRMTTRVAAGMAGGLTAQK